MSTVTATSADPMLALQTLDELVMHLGNIPPSRIRFRPEPGTATSADALEVARRERKLGEYFNGGARLVWEIDPVDRAIRVYTAADQFTERRDGDTLDGGAVLPGFTLAVTTLFDRAGRRA